MAVSAKKATGRRKLRFESYDDILADIDRLAVSPVRCLGNWSLGQICRQLAAVLSPPGKW
jgi:hypothetical protein